MGKYFNSCTLFIVMWCLYYMQGVLYKQASVISQGIMLILALMMMFYAVKVNYEYSVPPVMKLLNVFLAVLTVYGVIWMVSPTQLFLNLELSQPLAKHVFLQEIYLSLMPIYPMYYFARNGYLTESVLKATSLILLVEFTCVFFFYQNLMVQEAMEYGAIRDEFTNNVGYKFLHIFPLLLFWNKRTLTQLVLIAYMITFIIMSFKRGAIIVAAIGVIWYIVQIISNTSHWKKVIMILGIIVLLSVGTHYVIELYDKSDYFQLRVADTLSGDASERDEHFPILWRELVQESSLSSVLFGRGAASTVKLTGNFAHNDWLELAICHGLLGILLYIFYYILFYKETIKCRPHKQLYGVMVMCMIIMFVTSLFSMSLYGLTLPITMSLGYCIAKSSCA